MSADQGDEPAVLRARRLDLVPAGQEVDGDPADHMKAIGDDARLRGMFFHQRSFHTARSAQPPILPPQLRSTASGQLTCPRNRA
jgi:hypothetical protein